MRARPSFVILILCFASIALADDFKTTKGKEYKNATVSRVEPDGIVIRFTGGIVKIPFAELSQELQQKYGYNPEAAKQFAADVAQKQQALYLAARPQLPDAASAVTAPTAKTNDNATPNATATPAADLESRNARRQRQAELRDAQNETQAMKAESRGDHFGAKVIRIRAEYEKRIRAAKDAGNQALANELEKQAETKIFEAGAREEQKQGR
jgi:hypothetical protein